MNNDDIENIMTEYRAILIEIDKEWNRIAARYNFECEKCGSCCSGCVAISRKKVDFRSIPHVL